MSYNQEFEEACATSQHLGLPRPPVKWITNPHRWFGQLKALPTMQKKLQQALAEDGVKTVGSNCAQISVLGRPYLAAQVKTPAFDTDVWVTIGWLEHENEQCCRFTTTQAKDLVYNTKDKQEIQRSGILPFHVWLTLGTGEVFDMTFLTTWGEARKGSGDGGTIMCGPPDQIAQGDAKTTFHPSVIGEGYFRLIGLAIL